MANPVLLAAFLTGIFLPVANADTLSIPTEDADEMQADIDRAREMGSELSVDFSSPQAMLESIEDSGANAMLEAMGFGENIDVVWEMEVRGGWHETVSGEGNLTVMEIGQAPTLYALLEDGAREAPLILGIIGDQSGLGTLDNHFFEHERVFGHARDSIAMQMPGFSGLEDLTEDFLQTLFVNDHIHIVHAGEDEDGNASWLVRFSATLQEEDARGNPTGRLAGVRGWLCDAASYADDPEQCQRDDFELVRFLPTHDRGNVNPDTPGIEVHFSEEADLNTLEQGFSIFTRDAYGSPIDVEGEWSQATETEYYFTPDEPLLPGVSYDVQLTGNSSPNRAVRSKESEQPLEETTVWRFSTLLNLDEQGVDAHFAASNRDSDGSPVAVDVYQVVMNPRLTPDKQTMSRIRADWEPHEDIHPSYQPDSFDMALTLSPEHGRVVGQKKRPSQSGQDGRLVELYRQDEFNQDERRNALHTVNAFDWKPVMEESQLEVTLQPEDVYPEPLAEAIIDISHPLDYWTHDPGTLTVHYLTANVGDWESPDFESTGPLSSSGYNAIKNWLNLGEDIPQTMLQKSQQVLSLTEQYIPQFLPYRDARSVPTGVDADDMGIFLSALRDPVVGINIALDVINDIAISDLLNPVASLRSIEKEGELTNREMIAAYLRWIQRIREEDIDSEDVFVMFVPEGTLGEDTVGLDLTSEFRSVYRGVIRPRSRAIVLEIGSTFDADQLAATLVHEIAHTFGLGHNPGHSGDVPSISPAEGGHKHPGIEGFRLDHTGVAGHSKSSTEGNAEEPFVLVSIMWPNIIPSRMAMPTHEEYEQLQNNIEAGFRY